MNGFKKLIFNYRNGYIKQMEIKQPEEQMIPHMFKNNLLVLQNFQVFAFIDADISHEGDCWPQ